MATQTIEVPPRRTRSPFSMIGAISERAIPDWLLPLLQRLAISAVFLMSGRTKVDGLFTLSDSTFFLFEQEYSLPLISPEVAAYAATIAEHVFPILLILGLLTRLSATALLIMTLVIQFLVYPEAWAIHLTWVALLVPLIARGGGQLSLDRLLKLP